MCADFKRCTFARLENGVVTRSPLGQIVEETWTALSSQFPELRLHGHIVMPNHVHGIIEILPAGLAQPAAPLQGGNVPAAVPRPHSLSIIVRTFKAEVTRRARLELNYTEEIWQKNYYDRVIRDGREFSNAARYIAENPLRWEAQRRNWAEEEQMKEARLALPAAPLQRGRN